MKFTFSAVLAALLIIIPSTYAADPIALTVSYGIDPNSGPQVGELGLGQHYIFKVAKAALEEKGWKVVRSPSEAHGGAEVLIDVNAVQNAGGRGGPIYGFAVAIGMYGVSNGSSAVADTKRVAFNYSSGLVSFGGSYDYCIQQTREKVVAEIKDWIASSF